MNAASLTLDSLERYVEYTSTLQDFKANQVIMLEEGKGKARHRIEIAARVRPGTEKTQLTRLRV